MRRQGTKKSGQHSKGSPPLSHIFCKFYIMKGSNEIQTLLSSTPLPRPIFQNLIKNRESKKKKGPCNLVTNRRHLPVEYSSTCFCLVLSFYALFLYLSRLLASFLCSLLSYRTLEIFTKCSHSVT